LNPLHVWIDEAQTGILSREGRRHYVFDYVHDAGDAVSLTMPLRLQSWISPELHPIFQMNLPEGALLEAIRRAIAKIIGDDDLSLLLVTGGEQIGRNRFSSAADKPPAINGDVESLEELLTYPDTQELFHELVGKYAIRSGVSGIQPKVLLDATSKGTLFAAGFIVKSWGSDYPCLGANEFFCMTAARTAGLNVPEFHLSDNGGLFLMRRFDRDNDGCALGFEDMCSLQALGTSQKYAGSYERVAKSLSHFISGVFLQAARRQFFATLVLSSMVRNGDAHLKNFGVLYPSPREPVRLAPIYDIVTTVAYLRHDIPALSLAGAKKWWPRKMLEQFAVTHLLLTVGEIDEIFARLADAVMETRRLIPTYISEHPEFRETGEAMLAAWASGVEELCGQL